jgi:hypothetical protein
MPIISNKKESVALAFLITILTTLFMGVGLGVAFVAALANGWVGMYLWKWFVTPFGIPPISFIEAAGLATLFAFWAPVPTPKSDSDQTSGGKVFVQLLSLIILRPLLTLLFGYVLHRMMV